MRKSKVKYYDAWGLKALKAGLLESMADMYCFVWDLRQSSVHNKDLVLVGISNSARKSAEMMAEIELRGH